MADIGINLVGWEAKVGLRSYSTRLSKKRKTISNSAPQEHLVFAIQSPLTATNNAQSNPGFLESSSPTAAPSQMKSDENDTKATTTSLAKYVATRSARGSIMTNTVQLLKDINDSMVFTTGFQVMD
ncbi:MAG: hypothetical protein GOMPHAMPRED_008238 [Gomphillus americanus]|uniref:Uncharacterized protein n=1 Tax=Gomphillus americanus TaxID=1940652 RepID=A0A8H3F5K1_9LECA|nr:MAG: hypothetical protein GOMPHAMPRED_008238 [Gomphillus americanus]